MQLKLFHNTTDNIIGFVMHKVEGRFSCWYDAAGVMLDCERIDKLHRAYRVREGSKAWQRLAKLGPIYRDSEEF
jgi:hypothetical protein